MTRFETDLQMTERHVREGEVQLAQQRHILSSSLTTITRPTKPNDCWLSSKTFSKCTAQHYARLRAP